MSDKMKKNFKKMLWTVAAVVAAKLVWNVAGGDEQSEKLKQQLQG